MHLGGFLTTQSLPYLPRSGSNLPQNDIMVSNPTHQALNPAVVSGSKVVWPAHPVCSSLGEETMCQRISSHQSLFLIFFLLVCPSEVVYLQGVTFRQRTGSDLTHWLLPRRPCFCTSHITCSQLASSGAGHKSALCFVRLSSFSSLEFFSALFAWISPLWPVICFFPSRVSFLCLSLELRH